jgi:NAD(P)-dependent dehydrogenase (short-subunit alcohol dehydrogenase family)
VPDQHGRNVVVTGANSGIGFETALVLAGRGATVTLACRDRTRAGTAADRIGAAVPGAAVEVVELDLASLASVRAAAERLRARFERIDLLVNNAGLMGPAYGRTADGFEQQFGTNHLGHFALTGLLLDRLLPVPGSRVVTVSSLAHKRGAIDFADLQSERRYRRHAAYAQSKLANLLFTYELQDRLAASGVPTIAVAAHPGSSQTGLTRHLPELAGRVYRRLGSLAAQDARHGALPTLRAATDPAVAGGQYYGPGGIGELKGDPTLVTSTARSHDVETRRGLWRESERLTGVTFPV